MKLKKALILQGGTMRGAFIVGAMASIYELLGPNYFDAIYSSSVGIFEQVFFASGQLDIMQNTWKNYVHGTRLINPFNIIKGRQVLDLDYLVGLFQSDKSRLDLDALSKNKTKLFIFLTDYRTKKPVVMQINKNNVFDLMKAACAIPILYSEKVIVNGQRYFDAHQASITDFQNLLATEIAPYAQAIGIINFKDDPRMRIIPNLIKPSKMPLLGSLDTNRQRIIKTIEQGKIDAANFIHNFLSYQDAVQLAKIEHAYDTRLRCH